MLWDVLNYLDPTALADFYNSNYTGGADPAFDTALANAIPILTAVGAGVILISCYFACKAVFRLIFGK